MIYVYSQLQSGMSWLRQYSGAKPSFACILGFTATGTNSRNFRSRSNTRGIENILRIADAEFLAQGIQANYQHPLPILNAGVSPNIY